MKYFINWAKKRKVRPQTRKVRPQTRKVRPQTRKVRPQTKKLGHFSPKMIKLNC